MVRPFFNPKDEDAWLRGHQTTGHLQGYKAWLENQSLEKKREAKRADAERDYLKEFEALGQEVGVPHFSVDSDPSEPMYDRIMEKLKAADRFGVSFLSNGRKIEFEGKWLTTLKTSSCVVVRLRKCRIAQLILGPGPMPVVDIVGCKIGELVFSGQIQKFNLRNSDIRKVSITQQEFLSGPVSIRGVSFSNKEASVQALRGLRAELVRIHNLDAAGPVHAAEQWISRKELGVTDWIFSVLYAVVSAYGSSTLRPLGWSFALAGVSAAIVFAFAGTVLTERPLLGWQNLLSGTTETASAARAAYLTLNQILNPLGVFGINPLVVSTDAWIAAASALICFLATVSLGLFALALRRRFRLDGR